MQVPKRRSHGRLLPRDRPRLSSQILIIYTSLLLRAASELSPASRGPWAAWRILEAQVPSVPSEFASAESPVGTASAVTPRLSDQDTGPQSGSAADPSRRLGPQLGVTASGGPRGLSWVKPRVRVHESPTGSRPAPRCHHRPRK